MPNGEKPTSNSALALSVAATVLYECRMDNLGRHFAAAGLSPVVVKGQAVVDLAYPKGVPRLASDIDLLVGDDEEPVCGSLLCAGYQERLMTGRRFSSRLLGERCFVSKDPQLPSLVEVHRFLDKAILRPIDYAAIIGRAQPSGRSGFRYPQIEDLLLLVVLHESVSTTPSVQRTKRDIKFILANAHPDMSLVYERAKRWQLRRALEGVFRYEGTQTAAPKLGLTYMLGQRRKHDRQATWALGIIRYSGARLMDWIAKSSPP